ncbi:GNAT superfamily N-acetyltransferase [Duganella sp. 1411]|jgi:GNAT superfamily N-acetyltransferase|uniref:GNAT family N-acetyltransferase n=1 Tax=Duganella sp. 1411 TaxID=2806572 RepID=UPI001AE90F8C|nr:GNAT family N-acetyltransferase [Duganella sp. 1411]MBP1203085.1 GNAT superfamily N-acetyltransferase [Duganella sp. 1411]
MSKQGSASQVAQELLTGWLAARSIARGLPLPVPDHGGLRVDTGSAEEVRRYVFAGPAPEIRALALSITAPRVFIKMCGHGEQLLDLVPPGWELQPAGYLMTHDGSRDVQHALPAEYRLELVTESFTRVARIFAADGNLAASGYAVEYGGVFIFDRIVTEDAHQRRGLGRAVMAALGSTQCSDAARRLLVATDAGRALYSTLGWSVLSPFSTVVIR